MELQLRADYRTEEGKNVARRLRRSERVPAVLYGYNVPKAMPLSVDTKEIQKLLGIIGEETRIIQLSVKKEAEEVENHQVLIRDVQVHPYKRQLLHVDFYALAADQLLDVDVPIELVGESPAVKKGGVVDQLMHTLSVRCLPHEIPDKIEIDVSVLDLGDVIHVKDIKSRYSFRIMDDDGAPILSVNVPEDYESKATTEVSEEE